MPRRKSVIKLLPVDRDQAKVLTALVAHHRQLAAQLEANLHQLLAMRYGVDLVRENWNLNIDTGVLTREPPTTSQQSVPPPAR